MTTFFFEAPLLIEPKGVLKVTGMAKPTRPFDIYHKPPMFVRGVLGSVGNIDIDRPHVRCQLDFVQTWGPIPAPVNAFDLDQVRIDVTGALRA